MALGQSFAPIGGGMDDEERKRRMNQAGARPGGAIQTLGLRLPRVGGAQQPIPQAILGGGGQGPGAGNPLLNAIIRSMIPGLVGQPGMGQPGMGMPGMPAHPAQMAARTTISVLMSPPSWR